MTEASKTTAYGEIQFPFLFNGARRLHTAADLAEPKRGEDGLHERRDRRVVGVERCGGTAIGGRRVAGGGGG